MNTPCRAAFERDYFGDLPASVPARAVGSHGMYIHAAPQHAWTIWQRAWAAAAASEREACAKVCDGHRGGGRAPAICAAGGPK